MASTVTAALPASPLLYVPIVVVQRAPPVFGSSAITSPSTPPNGFSTVAPPSGSGTVVGALKTHEIAS